MDKKLHFVAGVVVMVICVLTFILITTARQSVVLKDGEFRCYESVYPLPNGQDVVIALEIWRKQGRFYVNIKNDSELRAIDFFESEHVFNKDDAFCLTFLDSFNVSGVAFFKIDENVAWLALIPSEGSFGDSVSQYGEFTLRRTSINAPTE